MKPRLLLFVCASGLLLAAHAPAAPLPADAKNPAGPIITLQTKSIDHLLGKFKQGARNFLRDAIHKEFEKEVLSKIDLSFIKGIDTQKPLGLYANFDAGLMNGDFSKSSVIALVPVSDEKDFLALLEKIQLKAEKKGDGYTFPIPNAPVEGSLLFSNGYAYIGVSGDKFELKSLLDPKEVIDAKETAALVLRIRIDRIPDDLKKAGMNFMDSMLEMAKQGGVPEEAKEILGDYLALITRWTKMGMEDGKEIAYRLDFDPKAGAFAIECSVDPKKGSRLARSFTDLKPTKNDFTGIIGDDSAGHLLIQTPLFVSEVQSMLLKAVDLAEKKANTNLEKDAPPAVHDMVKEAFTTVRRTLKNGNLDFAASMRGPDKKDQYTAVGAFSLKDTAALEKAIKAGLNVAPKEVIDTIKVDAFKVGDVNVHEIMVGGKLPPPAQKIFGKSNIYVALAPEAVFVTFGADGKKLMEEVLSQKQSPKPAPLVHMEVSGKRLVSLIKALASEPGPGDEKASAIFEMLGKMDRLPVFSLKIEGGDRLVMREEIGLLPIIGLFRTTGHVASAPAQRADPKAAPPAVKKIVE